MNKENDQIQPSFAEKQNVKCPICGRMVTWFNDLPLRAFCWGTPENEHEEYSKIVKKIKK